MNALPTQNKKHYLILDGLRGVAAIMVVLFHILETFSGGNHSEQLINHGYLAVDFFFVLSGFVIGYAYDDRWNDMSIKQFFKRRIVRLHPMVIIGMIIGALLFYFQDSIFFPKISETSTAQMLLIMLIGFTLLPVPPSMDIRGWSEMHPLNGPAWSLFFEYIANFLYAIILKKLSNKGLQIIAFLSAIALLHMSLTNGQGDIIGGWSLEPKQLWIGFSRLMYPFTAGLLLSRMMKPSSIKFAFIISAISLVGIMIIPRVGHDHLWQNALYDSLCVIIFFPIIVYIGASGTVNGKSAKICKFLADISYPIYIIHYPFIYTFMAWVANENIAIGSPTMILMSAGLLAITIVLSYIIMKIYDMPVRRYLTNKFLKKPSS